MYLRSLDLPSGWTAEELRKFKAYIGENWRTPPEIDEAWRELAQSRPPPEPQPMPAAGHNNPPPDGDPGADLSYRFCLPTPEYVSRDRVRAFEQALQEQGDYGSRLAALDQAAYRVRAERAISHRAYRVYDAILDSSRGRHRCCLLDLDKVAYLAGVHDRSVASKVIGELETSGVVASLKFTEGKLGAPSARQVFVAPRVTAEDRAQKTSKRVYREAEGAKVAALRKRAENARERRGVSAGSGDNDEPDPCSGHGVNYDGVVDASSTTGGLVDGSPVCSGQGVNTVYQRKNTKRKKEGEDGVVEAAATTHANGNPSATPSYSPPRSYDGNELIAEFAPAECSAGGDGGNPDASRPNQGPERIRL